MSGKGTRMQRSTGGKRITEFDTAAWDWLMSYHWPGNVRELKNAIESGAILAGGRTLGPEAFAELEPARPPAEARPLPEGDGVLVPVVRNADTQPLKNLVNHYNHLIDLAHRRKLSADATGGSIATVTNFGTFGLTWATPIPLPEQTLVLGVGVARRVPQWDEAAGEFVPVMEANVTLSFDHRVLDGGAAGRLLGRVAELLGQPASL